MIASHYFEKKIVSSNQEFFSVFFFRPRKGLVRSGALSRFLKSIFLINKITFRLKGESLLGFDDLFGQTFPGLTCNWFLSQCCQRRELQIIIIIIVIFIAMFEFFLGSSLRICGFTLLLRFL